MQRDMDRSEAYNFLLTDTIFSNLVFSPHTELAFDVMNMLGIYNPNDILFYTIFGAFVSIIFNYLFGVILYKIYLLSKDQKIHARYSQFQNFFSKCGVMFLCLTFIPNFGKFIPLLSGFARFGIVKSTFYALLSKIFYYNYYIYGSIL